MPFCVGLKKRFKIILMKNRLWHYLLFATISLILYASCTKDPNTAYLGNWYGQQIPELSGAPRKSACAFVIGTKVYVGLGENQYGRCLADFWVWETNGGAWSEVTGAVRDNLGNTMVARQSAVAFSIDSLGYVGTGIDDNSNLYNDFWSYSPTTNRWTLLSNDTLPATRRYGSIAFSINHLGFVGCGDDNINYDNDFYKFNPTLHPGQRWTEITFPGDKRVNGGVFVIGPKAYVCTGMNGGQLVNDLVVYDSRIDKWTRSDSTLAITSPYGFDQGYTDIVRQAAAVFSIGGKGYVTWGATSTGILQYSNHTWEYDPGTGLWTRKTSFEIQTGWTPGAYCLGITVSASDRGFVGTGESGGVPFDQFYEFKPEVQFVPDE